MKKQNYWLLKTEPEDYSYNDLEQSGKDIWDGVRNNKAQKYLRSMKPGDLAFIYHTGKERQIVGVAKVETLPFPDPTAKQERFVTVEVSPLYKLNRPVPLKEIKLNEKFSNWELVRLPRLSVMPVEENDWFEIHHLAEQPAYK